MVSRDHDRFLELVLRNPVNRALLDRGSCLGVADWWLTAGAVFQTVWNCLDGRDPGAGISDYDLFYFDAADRTWEGEGRCHQPSGNGVQRRQRARRDPQ